MQKGKSTTGKRRSKAKKKSFDRKGLYRNLLVIFLLSFFISTALIVYLFGMTSDFFSQLFWCLLVVFLLISTTVLGIIPLVSYIVNKYLK